jgi:hypothetical protein
VGTKGEKESLYAWQDRAAKVKGFLGGMGVVYSFGEEAGHGLGMGFGEARAGYVPYPLFSDEEKPHGLGWVAHR